jgi:hypothetical protein
MQPLPVSDIKYLPRGAMHPSTSAAIDAIFIVIGQLIQEIDNSCGHVTVMQAEQRQYRQRFDRALGDCTRSGQAIQAFQGIENIVLGIKRLIATYNPASQRRANEAATAVADSVLAICRDVRNTLQNMPAGTDVVSTLRDRLATHSPITYESCRSTPTLPVDTRPGPQGARLARLLGELKASAWA